MRMFLLQTASVCLLLSTSNAVARPEAHETASRLQTVEGRAQYYGRLARKNMSNLVALERWQDAMLRLGRFDQLGEKLKQLQRKHPGSGPHWFALGRWILLAGQTDATNFFQKCRDHTSDRGWCYVGEALAHENNGRFADAIELLKLAKRVLPHKDYLRALRARLLTAQGQLDAAQALVAEWKTTDENKPNLFKARATLRIKLGQEQLGDVGKRFRELLKIAPDDATLYVLQAQFFEKVSSRNAAAGLLQTALSWRPNDHRTRAFLARLLLELERWKPAIAQFTELVDTYPQDAKYVIALGEAHLGGGAPERAIFWASRAHTLTKNSPEAIELRVRALIDLGHYTDALALRKDLYDGTHQGLQRRLRIAQAFSKRGKMGEAEVEYTNAVARHPKSPGAWVAYADWFMRRNQPARAEAVLRKGLSISPRAALLHSALGMAFEGQGYSPLARKAHNTAHELAPSQAQYLNPLARLEFLAGSHEKAIGLWETLKASGRADNTSLHHLSAAYKAMGEHRKAADTLETLVDRRPRNKELRRTLAELYVRLGRSADAIKILRAEMNLRPDDGVLHAQLAEALLHSGDRDAAARHYEEALKLSPADRRTRLTYAHFLETVGRHERALTLYKQQLARNTGDNDALAGLNRLAAKSDTKTTLEKIALSSTRAHREINELVKAVPKGANTRAGTVLRDERYIKVDQHRVQRIRHVRTVIVHTERGVERYRKVTIAFHSQAHPKILIARTLTPDGTSIDVPQSSIKFENPYANTPLYGDARQMVISFPQVEPGAVLDYSVETYQTQPPFGDAWWDSYILGNGDPTVRVRYELDQPTTETAHLFTPGLPEPSVKKSGGRTVRTWQRHGLPSYRMSEARESAVPGVFVSSMHTWADVDSWYDRLFRPQARPTSTVAIQAARIGRAVTNRVDRIAAVYSYVEQNIKYLGVEFGIGAYKPRPAESTLAQGQGDCKDMTALMVALLNELKIKAYPALVRPSDQGVFIPQHPSPGQFSHVLLYVPHSEGDFWLDATATLGTMHAIPKVLRGQLAFIVDGSGGRVLRIPHAQAQHHASIESQVLKLNQTGGGSLSSRIRLTGDLAGAMRQTLADTNETSQRAIIASPGFLLGGTYVPGKVRLSDLDSPTEAVGIHAELTDQNLATVRMDGSLILSPSLETMVGGFLTGENGLLSVDGPRQIKRTLKVFPPAGYQFDWTPINKKKGGPISLSIAEQRGKGSTQLTFNISITEPPTNELEAKAFKLNFGAIRQLLDLELRISPGPEFDQLQFLRLIAKEQPNDSRVLLQLGRLLISRAEYRAAIETLDKAETIDPTNSLIWALLAAAHVQVGHVEAAEQYLRRVLSKERGVPRLHSALALLVREQGRLGESLEVLKEAHRRFPQHAGLHRKLAEAFLESGDLASARKTATRLADNHIDDIDIQLFAARIEARAGANTQAERRFRAVLSARPNEDSVLNDLAWLLRQFPNRLQEAENMAQQAVALAPDNPNYWDTLSELQMRLGQLQQALRSAKQSLGLSPEPEAATLIRYERLKEKLKRGER